jgi:HPt (histidine-containing phosphotransfer) domain-containing protein
MGQSATETVDQASSSRAPSPAIDRGQLARVTFGDRNLEHEVLTLFDRQSALLLERMRAGDGATIEALAHTMKGSAASIGADTVARAAEAAERAASGPAAGVSAAIDRLAEAVAQARALIAELLRAA